MAANLGVTVVEVDGRSTPTVAGAATSVAGFLVRSERGVPHLPVRIRGFTDFTSSFGSHTADAFGAYAVRGFFDNGGADAYVVRATGAQARAARVDLVGRDPGPTATLRVTAGQHGREDPGGWGNELTVTIQDNPRGVTRVPPQVIGTAAEPFSVPGDTTVTFTVTTRGLATDVSVRLTAADFATADEASAEEVARAINRQSTAVRAAVVPGGRLAVWASHGDAHAWTRLEVTGADLLGMEDGATSDGAVAAGADAVAVATASGFAPGSVVRLATRGHTVGTAGLAATVEDGAGMLVTADGGQSELLRLHATDFTDPTAITAAEVAAALNRQALLVRAEVTATNRLVLLSNRLGAGSTVSVAAPGGDVPDARAALALAEAAAVPGAQAFRVLTAASETHRVLAWPATPALPALPAGALLITSAEFDLIVRRDGDDVERFENLSMVDTHPTWAPAVVNDPVSGSAFVVLQELDSPGPGLDVPASGTFALGATTDTDGRDGDRPTDVELIGDPATRTGLEALSDIAIQLLACPETTSAAVAQAAIAWCERRGDAMYVGTVPRGIDRDGAKAYAASLRARKSYGALYAPWIEVLNPLDSSAAQPRVAVPPVGQVLGVYARTADTRGAWKAPAGDEARLVDAVGVEYDMTDADHTDLVRVGGVNGIRAVPGSGIVVDASRTLSTDTRWLYVNVRRLFNLVKTSLRDGLTFVQQEPHTEELRRSVTFNVVTPFLLGLWRQGAFGSDPPEQVFTVRCDASNNPPADVALGIFTLEVLFYPAKPVESILVVVGQQDSGASATDA